MNLNNIREGELKEVFDALEEAFLSKYVNFYLIGALAKDVWYSMGDKVMRTTRDVDFAVMISNKADYEEVRTYCNRFYNRQFITRKQANHTLLSRMEALTSAYFNDEQMQQNGLPTVKHIADQLNVSPNYLSDMLRSLTGQSAQQHIHNKLIEKAKEMLATTSLSVSEVAYHLGFEHPQSFNKLFKNKTQLSPTAYKESLN